MITMMVDNFCHSNFNGMKEMKWQGNNLFFTHLQFDFVSSVKQINKREKNKTSSWMYIFKKLLSYHYSHDYHSCWHRHYSQDETLRRTKTDRHTDRQDLLVCVSLPRTSVLVGLCWLQFCWLFFCSLHS